MTDNELNEEAIFTAALEYDDPDLRAAYLSRVCGGNSEMYGRVEALLRADQQACHFLEESPIAVGPLANNDPSNEGPGTVVGRYRLLQEIGEGGFGAVYMAEQQEPVMRRVALKIIKLGMDTRQVVARFEAERQALAMMDHPNIAKVHDGGATDTGRPYFVMELVCGIPITEHCDENNLSTNERLELFVDTCRAVQHAHQKGVIHRDIKPTNVMVALHDGRPMPKVIDFGIAKATQHRLTERTVHTDHQRFVGTPQYMSPEQATMSDRDVDTRTDIYSLGVLLYELLVGNTPFPPEQLRDVGYDEICRIIRENDPLTPSRCLSTLGEAATTEVSRHRQAQPSALQRQLRGDLDWIVMKALEKDRNRRYETANDFAADVERYLKKEPVEARHPSAVYTFGKFARRNRSVLTTVSLVAVALVVGTAVSVVLAAREFAARSELETQHKELQQQKEQTDKARRQAEDLRFVSDMNRAEQCGRDRDWRLVRQLLRAHHPSPDGFDRRGWEWRHLWLTCRDFVPTFHHAHIVNTFAISPDGTTLVSGDGAGKLYVWDVRTRQELSSTQAHRGVVWDVEFSPDGRVLASSGFDNDIRLWRIGPNKRALVSECVLEGDTPVGNWQRVTFANDGNLLATGGREGKVRLWDLAMRERVIEIAEDYAGFALALHPDGQALAVQSGNEIVVWPLPYDIDESPWVIPGYDNVAWTGLAFSPDGQMLAASWKRIGVDLYNVNDRKRVHRLQPMSALAFAFSPDSKTLAVGQGDKTVSLVDTTTGERLRELAGHSSAICCVRFTRDGRTLASSSFDKTVRLWPLNQGRTSDTPRHVLRHHRKPVEAMSFSPDGRWLATAEEWSRADDKKVVLWDTANWHVAKEFSGSFHAFSHDGRILAIGGAASDVQLWDLHAHQDLPSIPDSSEGVLAFSPNGNLATLDAEKMRLWDPYEAEVRAEYFSPKLPPFTIIQIGFSPDGKTLAATDYCGDIALFDAKTLRILQHRPETLEMFGPDIAFSPDSCYWATPDYDHTVKVWDVRNGKLELFRTLRGHTDSAVCAAFSPDGRFLAVGCANGSVRLWDSTTWAERATLKCHEMAIRAICFSPDGSTLVTGSDDTTVRIHRAASPEEVAQAEGRGNDPLGVDQ